MRDLTIIGAGAIGGTIGAHMIRAGHDVLLCDTDEAHVEAINRDGLHIEGPVENFTVRARAVTPDGLPAKLRHVAIAVKSHHTAAAAEPLRNRLSEDGFVVSFQNGFTSELLAEVVGRDRVVTSFVNFGADLLAPGRIMQGNVGTFRVGEPFTSEITPRVRQLAAALPYAEPTGNILGYLWGKEAYGAMLYAGAVSDLSIADALEDPRWRPLVLAIAGEVLAQAPVKPEGFDGFDPADLEGSLERLVVFNRTSGKSHSGIYRDLVVRKRKTEVDHLLSDLAGPLTTYTGELIRAIERGERSCEVANLELLAAYERVERLGRPLHAVVQVLPAPLRAATGPLHGVPVAVKDLIAVAGVPRGCGNPTAMAGTPSVADARVVSDLRRAGADVLATTALLEYAAGALHPKVPETLNPYDPSRTAGGSSGGSAALVAAGACPVALGTDTGGSIRIPAHYCAIVGLKPSFGALSVAGVEPLSPSLDHVGLLGADVAITARVFAALSGAPLALSLPLALPLPLPPTLGDRATGHGEGRRAPVVGVLSSQLESDLLTSEVAGALRNAVERLGAALRLVETGAGAFEEIDTCTDDILLYECWQVHRERVEHAPEQYGPETLRLLRTASTASRAAYDAALARRAELLAATEAAYDGVDVLLNPAAPFVAPPTTPPIDTPEGEAEGRFTRVFNVTGAPALVLPCGWSADGLPIGLQLSARRGADLELLAAAAEIERLLAFEPRPLAIG